MLKFKNIKSGKIVEVTEEFANQVLRPQGKYEEFKEEVKRVSKKKTSKVTFSEGRDEE